MSYSHYYRSMSVAWEEIAKDLELSPSDAGYWFGFSMDAYTGLHRVYHGKNHIETCWQFLHQLNREFSIEMKLAIMFHDIVYDPLAKDNEEKSVEVYRDFADMTHASNFVISKDVEYFIMGTKHNKDAYEMAQNDEDLAYVMDVDIAVLGAPLRFYEEYMIGVRKEYLTSGVSEKDYNKGRYKFLDSMLKLDNIFHTEEVRKLMGESNARKNIKYEISLLKEHL